jgi:hypothetical protein
MSDLATSLDAALAELAVDPIGVLRASGLKGDREHPCQCPVARYLSKRTGRTVRIDSCWATISGAFESRLPERARQAVSEIDDGEHRELCV